MNGADYQLVKKLDELAKELSFSIETEATDVVLKRDTFGKAFASVEAAFNFLLGFRQGKACE